MRPDAKLLAWVCIDPEGRVLVDTRDFYSETAVWRIVLGWPAGEEIEAAKRQGWRVCRREVSIAEPPPPYVPSVQTEPGDRDGAGLPLRPGT